jgi:hypothetical protein
VNREATAGRSEHCAGRTEVVEVTVSDQDLLQRDTGILDDAQDAFRLATRVDQHRAATGLAAQKRAILLIRGHRDDSNVHKGKANPVAIHGAKRIASPGLQRRWHASS